MDASDRRKRAAEEAAEWWVLLQGESELPRAEREKYVDWLRESAIHVAEMLRIAQIHGSLEQFQGWSALTDVPPSHGNSNVVPLGRGDSGLPPDSPVARRQFPRGWLAVAASLAILAVGVVIWFKDSGQIIQTERGERREVALADGSVVQVDPETRLRVSYEPGTRRVVLERGRALFRVAKNPQRPFLVEAHETTVRAVGTAFAVERGGGESVIVTVAEGKVGVYPTRLGVEQGTPGVPVPGPIQGPPHRPIPNATHPHGSADSASPLAVAAPEIFLVADQQVTIAATGSAEPVQAVNSERALAWAEGKLIFDNSSVESAVAEFNRYNRLQLSIQDAELAQRRISGVFNAADPESFVAFIQSVTSVRVSRDEAAGIRIDRAH